MVFPYHSVTWFEWHITNNPDNISDETKKLWSHYKCLQKHNSELLEALETIIAEQDKYDFHCYTFGIIKAKEAIRKAREMK